MHFLVSHGYACMLISHSKVFVIFFGSSLGTEIDCEDNDTI